MLQLHTQLGLSRSGSDCKNLCENYQRIFNKPTSRLAALTSGAPVPAQRRIGPMRSTSPSAVADDKTAVPHWGCRSGPLPSTRWECCTAPGPVSAFSSGSSESWPVPPAAGAFLRTVFSAAIIGPSAHGCLAAACTMQPSGKSGSCPTHCIDCPQRQPIEPVYDRMAPPRSGQ